MKTLKQTLDSFVFFFAIVYLFHPETGLIDLSTGALKVSMSALAFVAGASLLATATFQVVMKRRLIVKKA